MGTSPVIYPGREANPALRRLQRIFGTYEGIAAAGGVTKQAVGLWMLGLRRPSAESCVRIEQATGGKVAGRHLRPDLFGRGTPAASRDRADGMT